MNNKLSSPDKIERLHGFLGDVTRNQSLFEGTRLLPRVRPLDLGMTTILLKVYEKNKIK